MDNATINLDQITDLDKLKSLAYDQIAAKEVAENNLRNINNRIATVQGLGDQFRAVLPDLSAQDKAGEDEPEA